MTDDATRAQRLLAPLRERPHSIDAVRAEEITGLPLCGLVENDEQLEQFAKWLASETSPAAACAHGNRESNTPSGRSRRSSALRQIPPARSG